MLNDLTSHVQASVNGRALSDLELLRYEVARSRVALESLKTKLGPTALTDLLREDTARSTSLFSRWAAASGGAVTPSTAEITVRGGTAEGFLAWFGRVSEASDEVSLLGSDPEHFVVQGITEGQEVIETFGGWGSPVHLRIKLGVDVTDLVGPDAFDDDYPIRMTGIGYVGGHIMSGAVVHQFANTADGFKAKLAIHYPSASEPAMIEGHRTHLALEFTNWVNMYLAEEGIRPQE